MGRRPTATILKLLRADPHTERLKDDAPKISSAPSVPPGAILTPAERSMFDWLLENVYLPGVHGTGDGAAFVKVARLWARVQEIDAEIKRRGGMAINDEDLARLGRQSRDIWQQLGVALEQIGGTPSGRVRLAGPRGTGSDAESSWDEVQ